MQSFGSDRVRAGKGASEQWILFSPRPKGWVARKPKTMTSAEHPGTAVMWEERFFEVVSAESSAGGGVRYVLEPWRDHHVMRVYEAYDDASEAHREHEHQQAMRREKGRKAANVAGIFTGLLPAIAQEQLGSELGLLPAKLTALSLIIPFAFLIWFANDWARRLLDPNIGPMPFALMLVAAYFFFESAVRLYMSWFQRRPLGSILGFFPYLFYYAIAGKSSGAVSPFAEAKGYKLYVTEPPEDVSIKDAYSLREPLLSLLSIEEQNALATRFGFDYRKHGFTTAWVILALAVAGVVSSLATLQHGPRFSAILSLVVAIIIGGEQVLRLPALRRGATPSILAVAIRPLTRKLLT